MNPDEIRSKRESLGISQQELAALVGCSQPTISLIERLKSPPSPSIMRKIESALKDSSDPIPDALETTLARVEQLPIRLPTNLIRSLAFDAWQRPDFSGDLLISALDRRNSAWQASVVMIDLAGHGARLMQHSAYLRGWVQGLLANGTPNSPRNLLEDLSDELRRIGIDASAIAIQLSGATKRNEIEIEVANAAFPPALVITGPPFKTESLGTPGPALPWRDGEYVTSAQYVLQTGMVVLATDGLLERLADGSQADGKRALLKKLTSTERRASLSELFATGVPIRDDELALVIRHQPWDVVESCLVDDNTDRHRAIRQIRYYLSSNGWLDPQLMQAVAEAVDNARQHARGSGQVVVRAVDESEFIRIEVEDDGVGPPPNSTLASSRNGFSIVRDAADDVYLEAASNGGTILGMIAKKPLAT